MTAKWCPDDPKHFPDTNKMPRCLNYSFETRLSYNFWRLRPWFSERAQNSAQVALNESSVRWNLTCFMSVLRYRMVFPIKCSFKTRFFYNCWRLRPWFSERVQNCAPVTLRARALCDDIWPVSCRFYGTDWLFRSIVRPHLVFLATFKGWDLDFRKECKIAHQ